jgi:phosphatidylserine/phosphatidylglycerophosphate/cardiolipin synthase-like enzyme
MGTDTHPPTASRVARKKRAATAVLVIACTLVIATAGIVAIALIFKRPRLGISAPPPSSCANTCTLIVEPDDGIAPIVAMMHNATRSIDLTIYELNDHAIESALIAAVRRGVTVRVLLSAGYDGAKAASANQTAYDALHAGGVPVHWGPGYFALVHQKSIVVDGDTALIMSFNLAEQYYATGRDFGIVDRDANDVTAIETTFINDWNGNPASAPAANDLVWSPGARTTLIALIAMNGPAPSRALSPQVRKCAPIPPQKVRSTFTQKRSLQIAQNHSWDPRIFPQHRSTIIANLVL